MDDLRPSPLADPSHDWQAPEKAQTQCKRCGAYRHLSSGMDPCRMTDVPLAEKKPLDGLFRENPETPEGKYHVQRRDGTTVEWPSFVLGGRDPMSPWTMRFYGILGFLMGHFRWGFVKATWRWANVMVRYRRKHGTGDPGMGRHRRDDPATVEKMKKGMSA